MAVANTLAYCSRKKFNSTGPKSTRSNVAFGLLCSNDANFNTADFNKKGGGEYFIFNWRFYFEILNHKYFSLNLGLAL
jgi:hypothetical protein